MTKETVFLKITGEADKATALEALLLEKEHPLRFVMNTDIFKKITGTPFAYWASESFLNIFDRFEKFENNERIARAGLQTSDDYRFLRLWWELNAKFIHTKWFNFAKGGKFSPYYADLHLVINWGNNDGLEIKTWANSLYNNSHWSRIIKNVEFYFKEGLTWPLRASRFGPSPLPKNSIFSIRGYAIIIENKSELLTLMAICNSFVFDYIYKLTLGRFGYPEFVVGVLQTLPFPSIGIGDFSAKSNLEISARGIWEIKQKRDQVEETSHVFLLPALLIVGGITLLARAEAWATSINLDESAVERLQEVIDDNCMNLYGIDEADRHAMTDPSVGVSDVLDCSELEDGEGDDEGRIIVTPEALAEDLASWLFGVAIGRWDAGLATGEKVIPPLPGPFDMLPTVSRGMLVEEEMIHPAKAATGRFVPEHDLLVDDEGHPLDLKHHILKALLQVAGAQADCWQGELEGLLGTGLRNWFRSSFFERHLKRYSKSRRKAPIYWQLGTPSDSYSVWLYYPRLTRDSLYRVLNEVVKPKVTYEEQRLTEMRAEGATRRQIEIQEGFVDELRTFREEVTRVAPLWNPDLDDGVLLNFAPLWRLTPHPGWRRDTKAAWDSLAKGDYDWAKLAMKLWPERVIPKCARDRHLALAHGLEASLQATPIEELVRVSTSPAVKDALQSLLTAPALGGSARAPRATTPRRVTPAEETTPIPSPRSRGTISEETLTAISEAMARYPLGAAKADILESTNLTDAAWNAAIQVLLDRGEVERRGEKRGTRYFLKTLER